MTTKLAPRLILSLTVLVALVRGLSGFMAVRAQQEQMLTNMVLGADQLSKSITGATWHAMLADQRQAAYDTMQRIAEKQGIARIRIFNKDGRVMFSTDRRESAQVDKRAEVCAPCHDQKRPPSNLAAQARTRIDRETDDRRTMSMITPIPNEPACSQAACHAHPASVSVLGVLDVGMDLAAVDRSLADVRSRAIIFALVEITMIGVLIALFVRHFVTRPISSLMEGTARVSELELDEPVRVPRGSGEVAELAESFDRMRERLRESREENARFTQRLEAMVEARTAELKAAHQRLIQTDRLASLGQLAASVAHEINNPVSGVLNLSMLMQRIVKEDGIPAGRISEFRRYLEQVAGETARVGRIVSDLLAFSRRSRPHTAETDLNGIIRTTLSLVGHKLELSDVVVRAGLAADLPRVRCDASQVQQVALNLVLNGAEAMPDGGVLAVSTHASADGRWVVLQVHDDGAGMSQQVIERIFQPFFTTKEEGKGLGLGLSVVYGIVQAHGGEIEVDSAPGRGTTFTVTLPVDGGGAAILDVPDGGEQA